MPSPFPGMDLYLEKPSLGRDVHHGVVATTHRLLNAQLRPDYFVRVGERVYFDDEPFVIAGRKVQPSGDELRDRAGYNLEIDYKQEPIPPLDDEMAAWADQLLRSKGLR